MPDIDFNSEIKFERIIDSIGDPIHIINKNLEILYFNPSFAEWLNKLNLPPIMLKDSIKKNFPFISDNVIDEYNRVIARKKSHITHEKTIVNGSTVIWTETRKIPVFNSKGNVSKIITIIRDETEIMKVRLQLEDLASFPYENPNPVLRVNQNTILFSNSKAKEIFDITQQNTIPRILQGGIEQVLLSGHTQQQIVNIHNSYYSLTLTPVEGKNYINIYGIDITTLITTKKSLQISEHKYRIIAEQANDLIAIIDRSFHFLYINKSAHTHQLGYEPSELLGKQVYNFVHPIDRKMLSKIRDEAIRDGEIMTKIRLRHKSGNYIWFEVNVRSYTDKSGNLNGILISRNISERRKLENRLKTLDRMKSEILNRVSHELKTPLTSVRGNAELLKIQHPKISDLDSGALIDEILAGTDRLLSIIKTIITSSKLITQDVKLHRERVNLAELITDELDQFKDLIKSRGVKLQLNLESDSIISLDPTLIRSVVENLISNAIKFTPPKGNIVISLYEDSGSYIVSIQDNGIGFTEIEKEHIFQMFGKIERYGKNEEVLIEGTGLGLFISKKIVELHEGKIWMESQGYGQGSIFYFSLPIH